MIKAKVTYMMLETHAPKEVLIVEFDNCLCA